jgi:hypothetical protein
MPYKDPEQKRRRDQDRYQRLKKGVHPNPLTPDQWRTLQRAVYRVGQGEYELLRRVAEVWNVPVFW